MTLKTTKCPKCNAEFIAAKARTYPGVSQDLCDRWSGIHSYEPAEDQVNRAAMVECPECHYQFVSEDVRFFGFLSPMALKILLVVCFFAFIITFFCSLIIGVVSDK